MTSTLYFETVLGIPKGERTEFIRSQESILETFNSRQLVDVATLLLIECTPELAREYPIEEKSVSLKRATATYGR